MKTITTLILLIVVAALSGCMAVPKKVLKDVLDAVPEGSAEEITMELGTNLASVDATLKDVDKNPLQTKVGNLDLDVKTLWVPTAKLKVKGYKRPRNPDEESK